jgi:hypothetical protein
MLGSISAADADRIHYRPTLALKDDGLEGAGGDAGTAGRAAARGAQRLHGMARWPVVTGRKQGRVNWDGREGAGSSKAAVCSKQQRTTTNGARPSLHHPGVPSTPPQPPVLGAFGMQYGLQPTAPAAFQHAAASLHFEVRSRTECWIGILFHAGA